MNILCLGISHHTASVTLREQISLSGEALRQALRWFTDSPEIYHPLTEVAILSTCSRFEIYAVTPDSLPETTASPAAFEPLLRYATRIFSAARSDLEPHLMYLSGEAAVRHLFRVAASLDSMVLGEPQILGQVSSAHRVAMELGGARHVLSSLFRSAVHAGKRVRSETAIGRRLINMSAVAIRLSETVLGDLTERRVLVIGTGEIGQQSLKALREHGVIHLSIASRSGERARNIAQDWDAHPLTIDRLGEALLTADVVMACSDHPSPIISREIAAGAAANRAGCPLVLVDLAVPRTIDPAICANNENRLEGVYLFDMDDIQAYIASSLASRRNEVPRAEVIVEEETDAFGRWLSVIPVVGELHRRAESIRQQEVERTLHFLQNADPAVVEQIEKMSQSLVRKLLHEPTARLRHEADHANLENYMVAITSLFDLPDAGISAQG